MKKYFVMMIVTMMVMSMTACGSSLPEGETAAVADDGSSSDSSEYVGEGEVQGGMPTDEELEAREEEAESYEESSEDYSDANVEMETTPSGSDTYISADNFHTIPCH